MDPRRAVLRSALARSDVRRVELAYAGFNLAEYGVWVSVLVYAYKRGGTDAAALLAVAQLLPAAMLAPILARGIDRRGPGPALWHGYLAQAITLSATAGLLLTGAPPGAVWPAAICASVALTVTRPAQATLVPLLTRSRAELTAVNVLSSWVESVSVLTGAALAGGLIAAEGPGTAVAAFAVGTVLATAATAPLARLAPGDDIAPDGSASHPAHALDPAHPRAGLGPLLGLLAAQYLAVGLLDVAMVALAIGMLGLGASGAGYLNAALGAGGLLGSLLAVTLIAHRRMTPTLVGASLGWGAVVALLGIWPTPLGAFALLAGAGCGRSLLDVSGRTLLMRHSLPSDRARLFGALEGVSMIALAGGSALIPLLAILGGLRGALILVGALLSFGVLLAARNLQHLEGRDERPTPTRSAAPLTTTVSVPDVAVITPCRRSRQPGAALSTGEVNAFLRPHDRAGLATCEADQTAALAASGSPAFVAAIDRARRRVSGGRRRSSRAVAAKQQCSRDWQDSCAPCGRSETKDYPKARRQTLAARSSSRSRRNDASLSARRRS